MYIYHEDNVLEVEYIGTSLVYLAFPKYTHSEYWWRLATMYTISLTGCFEFVRHLGPGDQGQKIQQMIPGVKLTEMTSKVPSEGIMFLAFEVCRS